MLLLDQQFHLKLPCSRLDKNIPWVVIDNGLSKSWGSFRYKEGAHQNVKMNSRKNKCMRKEIGNVSDFSDSYFGRYNLNNDVRPDIVQ